MGRNPLRYGMLSKERPPRRLVCQTLKFSGLAIALAAALAIVGGSPAYAQFSAPPPGGATGSAVTPPPAPAASPGPSSSASPSPSPSPTPHGPPTPAPSWGPPVPGATSVSGTPTPSPV